MVRVRVFGCMGCVPSAAALVLGTVPASADLSEDLGQDDERLFRIGGRMTMTAATMTTMGREKRVFRRIATFPVFLNTAVNLETVAEIVAASEDGNC